MERDKKARTVTRMAFTRIYNEISTQLLSEDVSPNDVNANIELLIKKASELRELDSMILNHLLDSETDVQAIELESVAADEYQRKYEKIKLDALVNSPVQAVSQLLLDDATSMPASQMGRRKFKLPKIELKKFGGELKEWLQFWGQFRKIDEDEGLDDEDKFQYLIQSTTEGSRAREYIDSFPPTKENYKKAVEGLRARFGREDMLVEVYVRELLTLVLKRVLNKSDNVSLCTLYDNLESQLRALESLGVTTDKYASMLYPLVESSLPEDLLRTWQRRSTSVAEKLDSIDGESISKNRLDKLMNFLRSEVENEERISLATSGFSLTSKNPTKPKKLQENIPTAASLVNVKETKPNCVFCEKNHNSADCFKASKMTIEEKRETINKKKCCFYCLRPNHIARKCKAFIKCLICGDRHIILMCPKLEKSEEKKEAKNIEKSEVSNVLSSSAHSEVFLQTLVIKLQHADKFQLVRAMIDTGSQKSYIMESTAQKLELPCIGSENLIHSLFGGVQSKAENHKSYQVRISSIKDDFDCSLEVLGQPMIVQGISPIKRGEWWQELRERNIDVSDVGDIKGPIQLLIGADKAGQLFTGKQHQLRCGLVALQTRFGWTIMGKITRERKKVCAASIAITMFVKGAKLCDLWDLEILGVRDPVETRSRLEKDLEVKKKFLQDVKIRADGRYVVKLPWLEDLPELSTNYAIAERRLHSVTKKLITDGNLENYNNVFKEWCELGFIEIDEAVDKEKGHYLPHRPVIKENSSTRMRPVFDASAKAQYHASLNECLETGPNMIELIPAILLRFRMNKIGVSADIKKAFLQISVDQEDRDFLKFLWWNNDKQILTYRHTRVVFGVSSSPFLLGAVIDHHLNKTLRGLDAKLDVSYSKETINKLMCSFYVDNCLTSLNNEQETERFIRESKVIMAKACFELRAWEFTKDTDEEPRELSNVLGLKWDKFADTLQINTEPLKLLNLNSITKRIILSVSHKLYDPIGFLCPVTLYPKCLLQQSWSKGLGWDTEVDPEMKAKFAAWVGELHLLEKVKIPRWILDERTEESNVSIHTFCDASQVAYAAVTYVRVETPHGVKLQMLQAKTRVAPLKKITIPRLELMAATVGARLTSEIMKSVEFGEHSITYWSDSMTVLSWINRQEHCTEVFVRNRIREIHQLSEPKSWRHIAGEMNPADTPSRGCSIRKLIEEKWWEGPDWLKLNSDQWPASDLKNNVKINSTMTLPNNSETMDFGWYFDRYSSFGEIVRITAWINRFVNNCRKLKERKFDKTLKIPEIEFAERQIIRVIQDEYFGNGKIENIASLNVFRDQEGIIRVKTKIIYREDSENFRYPIVLPHQHRVVKLLIIERHQKLNHAGLHILLNSIREDYWVTKGRRAIREVLKGCVICKRFEAKNEEPVPGLLPRDRVRDARIFEVVGIDYAGPLFLKNGAKVWVCLFTCAIYRAVHLELASSLSTATFIHALRRFVARHGRPTTIYSDNGTNFAGTSNILASIDWKKIEDYSSAQKIEWKFNPPTAAWWGGWWERIIRIVKDLLKRTLGKSCISYEEMITILCDCEAIINDRPITYMMDTDPSVAPLTPGLFLHELREIGVPDLDKVDAKSLNKRIRYLQTLRNNLRQRFRNEYLGALIQHSKQMGRSRIKIGEIVLVGSDNQKRINWPLARITELIKGKDGECRLVRLKTSKGEILRPVQRIYRLEIQDDERESKKREETENVEPTKRKVESVEDSLKTKRGRIIRTPRRYLE